MTSIELEWDMDVKLIRHIGDDDSIIQAAQVSVTGENEADLTQTRREGLINYLIRERHGSPFEHNSMTFYVSAPIFVFREFQRHRIGFSYNEMSGRYSKLKPRFYDVPPSRPLQNVGSSAKPEFEKGTDLQQALVRQELRLAYVDAWNRYERLIDAGIANEVARALLPVGIYSEMYVTCNARSLMNFLTLRTRDERAEFVSRPQQEIEMVARKMEEEFAKLFPVTYEKFNNHGRVAP